MGSVAPNPPLTRGCPVGRGLPADGCFPTLQQRRCGSQPSLLAPSPLSPAACFLVWVFRHVPSTGGAGFGPGSSSWWQILYYGCLSVDYGSELDSRVPKLPLLWEPLMLKSSTGACKIRARSAQPRWLLPTELVCSGGWQHPPSARGFLDKEGLPHQHCSFFAQVFGSGEGTTDDSRVPMSLCPHSISVGSPGSLQPGHRWIFGEAGSFPSTLLPSLPKFLALGKERPMTAVSPCPHCISAGSPGSLQPARA